jgi:thioesterase domain-containing protein
VAIEVASTLAREGHAIECVGLIDTSTAPLSWDSGNKNRRKVPSRLASQVGEPMMARMLRAIMEGKLISARPDRAFALLGEMLLQRQHFATFGALWLLLNTLRLRASALALHTSAKVYLHGKAVIAGAWPPHYAGRVTLFRSDDPEWGRLQLPDDLGWSQYVHEVSVRRVPGDHMTMIAATNVDATVREVRDALCETF